jgi:membrane-associated protease RseP (regulator of RpoE activity)
MQLSRPPISRDTRRLLAIALASIIALWVFARVRFPDQMPTPNPVPPVLAQLTPRSAFDDIAASVAKIEPVIHASIFAATVHRRAVDGLPASDESVPAIRFRDDLAVALIDESASVDSPEATTAADEMARDWASSLAVIRAPGMAPALSAWFPLSQRPRFLMAAAVAQSRTFIRPVFIPSLQESVSPIWPGAIWVVPPGLNLLPATLMFSVEGAFAGLIVELHGQVALVPAATVLEMADRLASQEARPHGRLGVTVAPLTPAIKAATGATAGLVVAWVDPRGPAAGRLAVTDIIEAVGGASVATEDQWRARVAHLSPGESALLRVRQGEIVRDVPITAAPPPPIQPQPLGLSLRAVSGVGVEIIAVVPGSAAAGAGLRVGDVLTVIGGIERPTVASALNSFRTADKARPLLIALTRAGAHHVIAVERTW